MAQRKHFSVHDLYPEDYCFDYDAFEADPENYRFTAEDNAYLNAIEMERYEDTVLMPPYERRLLHRWVISGHSVHEPAISVSSDTIRSMISSMFTAWTARSGLP